MFTATRHLCRLIHRPATLSWKLRWRRHVCQPGMFSRTDWKRARCRYVGRARLGALTYRVAIARGYKHVPPRSGYKRFYLGLGWPIAIHGLEELCAVCYERGKYTSIYGRQSRQSCSSRKIYLACDTPQLLFFAKRTNVNFLVILLSTKCACSLFFKRSNNVSHYHALIFTCSSFSFSR